MTKWLESSGAKPLNPLSNLRHTERSEVSLTERTDRDSSGKYVMFYSPLLLSIPQNDKHKEPSALEP